MSTSAPSRIALAVSNEHIPPKLRPPELIPPGEYGMTGVGHDIEQAFDRSCLVVWFSVDDFAGEIVLPRYYTIGVRNERGRRLVSAKRNSNLVLDMRELFDQRFRLDRIPVSWFKETRAIGTVRTVTTNFRQEAFTERQQYSVIDELLRAS